MIATGWSNGQAAMQASSYGIRISPSDRTKHFRRSWRHVTVILAGVGPQKVVGARLSPSFWRSCPELRGPSIGAWLLSQGAAPWPKRRPPRFNVQPIAGQKFLVTRILAKRPRSRHVDGTACKEGMASLPKGFTACCVPFAGHTRTCEHDVRYEWWQASSRWVVAISASGGGGGVTIDYCPHCGRKLPTP